MEGFFGYGQYPARYWFIGMEEGGGSSVAYIAAKLVGWRDRGAQEVEELGGADPILGAPQWFGPYPRLQPTWNGLIRILLSAEGQEVTTEQVREYQRTRLG